MRGTSAISRLLMVAVVFGLAMLQTQPTVRAAEPTAPSSGSGPNAPAASSVPADPPLPANARLAALPPKPPAKLSSHLYDLVRATAAANAPMSPQEQSVQASLAPSGAGSLARDRRNNPVLDVRVVATSQAVLDELRAHGADILSVSPPYRTVTVAIDQSRIVDLSNLTSVEYVAPVIRPMSGRDVDIALRGVASAPAERPANATCGSVISEADTQLGAEAARTQFAVDGSGVKVGILSDSFAQAATPATTAAQDVASGDLPGPGNPCGRTTAVQVLKDTVVGADEGRAMLQAVHDLAPGASLAFATASVSETDFANQITALQTAGATVISDDVAYFAEPFYQDGPIAVAATNARAAGAFMVTMAFNNNAKTNGMTGIDWNGYEAQAFRPVACQAPLAAGDTCHNFSGTGTDTSYNFRLANNGTARIILQWAEPRFGVTQDIELYLVDTATNTIVKQSINNNPASGLPFEFVSQTNTSGAAQDLAVVVRQFSGGGTPRFKLIFVPNGSTAISNIQFATPNATGDTVGATIWGHNGAASELTVAATPYNDGVNAEFFSSHGPATVLFGPVTGTTPAPPITPVSLVPDVTATDGGANTFFGRLTGGVFRFFGTSQASPHAAGVAALLRQKEPSATPDQLKSAITNTATAMNGGSAVVGAGRVNAVAALNALSPICPSPRPNISRTMSQVNAGRLQVNLSTTAGTFTSLTTTGLSNAALEVNGAPLALNQTAALTGASTTVFVQRASPAGAFTARFSISDSCGPYPLFFGKGS